MVFKVDINVMSGKNNRAINIAIGKKWNKAIAGASVQIQNVLRRGLVYEPTMGLKPFTDTDLWKFLMQPETLAELGFISMKPLTEDLLTSILMTIFVQPGGGNPKSMLINVFDMQFIANATIHRSAGTGQLGPVSWFVDWIIKGVPVTEYHFEETGPPIPRSSRLAGDKAGLMIKGGLWQFPPQFRDAVDDWLDSNKQAIKKIVETSIRTQIGKV